MKVQNITNIDDFFNAVNKCKEKVELLTYNGNRLNLNSKLIQYVSNENVLFHEIIKELQIITHNPDDARILLNYMSNH